MATLHARCFQVPRPWSTVEFTSLLADPLVHLDLLEKGFALGRSVAGEAELLTIAVDPVVRGQGRGRALLQSFEASARRNAAHEAFLEVAADNPVAKNLYTTAGYIQAGVRLGYYSGVDALILRKPL